MTRLTILVVIIVAILLWFLPACTMTSFQDGYKTETILHLPASD